MKLRNLGSRLTALSIIATSVFVACSGGGGGGGMGPPPPTPTPTPVGITGCNSGASSLITAGVADTPVVRPVNRGQQQGSMPVARVSVKYSGTGKEPAVMAALDRVGAKQAAPVNPQGWAVIDLPQGSDAAAAAAALRRTPGIVDAAPAVPRYLQAVPNDPFFGTAIQLNSGPQTSAVQQDMFKINMPAAWDITKGSSSVIIAMIDTGYDANNADVCPKVVNSAVFDLGTGVQDVLATAQDNDGHGTNTSGIAASATDNSKRWAGVGWNVSLMEIRIFPHPTSGNQNPSASSADSAAAINYAVAHGAKVISMSYGSASSDPTESGAAAAAIAAGVILVGAAGNSGTSGIDFPAAYTGVIAVGASAIDDYSNAAHQTTPTEYVASYSNFGARLDVVAPGGDPCGMVGSPPCGVATPTPPANDFLQWVPNNYSTTAFSGTGFHSALFAGTSQATPHVAGLAALMASKSPGISPATAKSIIKTYARSISDPHQGAGVIDAAATLSHT